MRGALALALAVVVAAATGCGGDTKAKNDYVAAVNKAQADFVSVVDDSESRISGNASDAETAAQLDMIRAAAAKVVAELRAVKPPGNVRTLHNTLIHEAQGLVVAFRKAATAYRSANGSTWIFMGSNTISMAATIYVGLAVCSHNSGTLNTSTFDHVSVTSG